MKPKQFQLPLEEPRRVVWFSCGAASAVTTKLAMLDGPVTIAYCRIREEHPDNMRFLKDCEQWFGQEILILENQKYDSSIYEVFRQDLYLVGHNGARCTLKLKKEVRHKFMRGNDINIFGYLDGEEERLNQFIDGEPDTEIEAPCLEKGVSHSDCLALVKKAGIELPAMYQLGYKNNNCRGCVKGGMGYWNKIRVDFPEFFKRMIEVEKTLGRTVLRERKDGEYIPVPLTELDPNRGNYNDEPDISCGIVCEWAESQFAAE